MLVPFSCCISCFLEADTKILFVNKFLFEGGGAETYMFKLCEYYESMGHEVQFFGMDEKRNIVGNKWNILTKNTNFHKKSLGTLLYPFKIIYSLEARRKIKRLIGLFKPDVVHMGNFNYQITPSVIYEIKKHKLPLVYVAHDYQLVCPNHMLYKPDKKLPCEECLTSGFKRCVKNNCIHGSKLRSILGYFESTLYHGLKTYSLFDKVICSSRFLESKFLTKAVFQGKTIVLHNFTQKIAINNDIKKGNYVLYFGRFSLEKGINTLINVCKRLPEIPFVFAGGGPLVDLLNNIPNIKNLGFLRGEELIKTISEARFSVYPSEWHDNCPFSVIESQMYGTPVIGSNMGGIPELIQNGKTGFLFQAANADELAEKITTLWNNRSLLEEMSENCLKAEFETPAKHGEKVLSIYRQLINSSG